MYVIAVLDSSYLNIFGGIISDPNFAFFQKYTPLYLSFFNGSLWFAIGKMFAENENRLKMKTSLTLTIISFVLMYGELLLTNYFGLNGATDAFFTLIPFSCFLFQTLLNIKLKDRKIYRFARKTSTFIYLSHFSILYIFFRFVNVFNWSIFTTSVPVMIATYIVVVALCISGYILIDSTSKHKGFGWLKYST